MSTVKISELPLIPLLNKDTTQTLIAGVDLVTGITGKMTTKVLATSLYSNDVLNVGNNTVQLPNTVAQFASSSNNYVQVNLQNNQANGSADYVITADTGTDSTYYIDMGYNGSTYNYAGYTYAKPLDGYLVVQGNDNTTPGGNLVIGTTTAGKNISILVGSTDESKIMAKFVANTGFKMLQYPYFFADGTYQNTAAAPFAQSNASFLMANSAYASQNVTGIYANASYAKANSAGIYANGAFAQANVALGQIATQALSISSAQTYANGSFVQANAAFTTANNALANTNTATFANNVVVPGTLNVTGISTSGISINNGALTQNGNTTITGTMSVTGAVTMNTTLIIANGNFDYTNTAMVRIVGSTGGAFAPPSNPGYMLAITGIDGIPSRVINTGYGTGAYGLFANRSARGTAASPLAVANNDVLCRYSGAGYNGTAFTATGQGRIDIVADEDFTTANNGTRIEFYNTIPKTNTITKIATFNANTVSFTGSVNPMRGFVYSPRVLSGNQTAITVDFSTDSIIRATFNSTLTISLSNYVSGKIVDIWLTNTAGNGQTVNLGALANNVSTGSTTLSVAAGRSAKLQYFSIDGDQANTFLAVTYA